MMIYSGDAALRYEPFANASAPDTRSLAGDKNVPHCAAETEIEHEEKIVLSAFGLGNDTSHDSCGVLGR